MADRRENPRIFTPEEIELFLGGDRREIDRLILHSVNNVAAVLIPHMRKTDERLDVLGNPEAIRLRVDWINAQIESQKKRNKMMEKVGNATLIYALPLFFVYLIVTGWDFLVSLFKHKVG